MTRDNVVFRSIPLFTGSLAFVPACGDDGLANDDGDDSSSSSESVSASDSSSDDAEETSSSDDASTDPDSTSTSTADESSSSSDSGDPVCGDGTCGAAAPIGWFGPVVYARGEVGVPPPACPEGIDNPGPTVLDGFFDPGPAVCSCSCELSAPINCNARMTAGDEPTCAPVCEYYGPYNPQYCYGYSGNDTVTENCLNIDVPGFVRFSANQYYYYGYGGAVCEQEEEEAIPPFSWDASISTCRIPDSALTCAEGVCLPPIPVGFESKWCIYQTGDLECTDPNFTVKTTFWSNVEDTRACTNCQCGTADTSCEGISLQVFGGPDCAGEPVAIVDNDNVCTAALGQSVAGDFGEDGGCPVVEAPVPQGTIVPTGPFTFCCTE